MNTTTDRSTCPLCGGSNDCAMTRAGSEQAECWCMKATIGTNVLAKLPEALRDKTCICARCAAGPAPQR